MITYRNAAVLPELLQGLVAHHLDAATGLAWVDIGVDAEGRICAPVAGAEEVDLQGAIVLPTFLDSHVHLDKAYTVARAGIPAGGLMDAVGRAVADSCNWNEADLEARMSRALARAYANGTSVVRSHLDSPIAPDDSPSWAVIDRLRQAWAGKVAIQPVALMVIERATHDEFFDRCRQIAVRQGVLGIFIPDHFATPEKLDRVFEGAALHGLDVDFHVDETLDPTVTGLEQICDAVLRHDFKGRVVAGHCCALGMMPDEVRARVIAKVVEAGVHVISLPHSNLFLQDRALDRTPRLRGLTMVRELRAAGAEVHFASDNVQDPFYPYGDYDLIEVFQTAVKAAHLDVAIKDWLLGQFLGPQSAMGITDHGMIRLGAPADLVIFEVKSWFDFLSPQATRRTVLRNGQNPFAPMSRTQLLEAC